MIDLKKQESSAILFQSKNFLFPIKLRMVNIKC